MINIDEIKSALKNRHIGGRIFYHELLDSTNLEAVRLIHASKAKFGDVIIAKTQTSGKGQYGHNWSSPEGGLYMSIISASKVCELSNIITFVSGIACIDAVKSLTNIQPCLKWVNDIIINNKKLGGILTETTTRGDISTHVSGIGINVNSEITFNEAGKFEPVSLSQLTNDEININLLIARVCDCFDQYFNIFQNPEIGPNLIIDKWNEYSQISGLKVKFLWNDEELWGIAEGINKSGHLVVRNARITIKIE